MSAPRPIADGVAERVLSARQLEVLALIARGVSTDGIARDLVVSSCTVRTHVRNILGILGARNRAHAVAIACLTGLIWIDEYADPRVRDRAPSSHPAHSFHHDPQPRGKLDEEAPDRCRCGRPQSPDGATPRRSDGELMAPLAPREKALLIYALAAYAKMANGGPAATSKLFSLDARQRPVDRDQRPRAASAGA